MFDLQVLTLLSFSFVICRTMMCQLENMVSGRASHKAWIFGVDDVLSFLPWNMKACKY